MAYYNYFSNYVYLNSYPDVNANVNAPRGFLSGLEHFSNYGVFEGRTSVSALFDERAYLARYPDVANAVATGVYSSGVEHFSLVGYQEGRYSPIGTADSEQVYLKLNPDVAAAVSQGLFYSGYDHYLRYGQYEGRVPGYFNQQDYLLFNPDVAAAVGVANPTTGLVTFNSGFEHYLLYGQYENRLPFFSGTSGNDIVTSFGLNTVQITGVQYTTLSASKNPYNYVGSTGVGEIDTLIGNANRNEFLLALRGNQTNPNPVQLYVGGGNADYALIRSFVRGLDSIQLVGSINNYTQQVSGGNLRISTRAGDLVGIVEGVTTPLTTISTASDGFFFLG